MLGLARLENWQASDRDPLTLQVITIEMISFSPTGQNPTLTSQEIEYCKFLQSGTHERTIYTPSASCWYNRVGSNDQDRIATLTAAHSGLTKSTHNKMKMESEYAALFFCDIKMNENQWFFRNFVE